VSSKALSIRHRHGESRAKIAEPQKTPILKIAVRGDLWIAVLDFWHHGRKGGGIEFFEDGIQGEELWMLFRLSLGFELG
jgi:hypothetical protein